MLALTTRMRFPRLTRRCPGASARWPSRCWWWTRSPRRNGNAQRGSDGRPRLRQELHRTSAGGAWLSCDRGRWTRPPGDLQPGGSAAHEAVLREFGTVDRFALAKIVFNDPALLAALNAIVHPAVARRAGQRIVASLKDGIVVYAAAILIETGNL